MFLEPTSNQELLAQFIGEMIKTCGLRTSTKKYKTRLKVFLDELQPWLLATDLLNPPPPVFTIIEDVYFTKNPNSKDEADENVWVTLSPEGRACFRAWLRRQGIDPNQVCLPEPPQQG